MFNIVLNYQEYRRYSDWISDGGVLSSLPSIKPNPRGLGHMLTVNRLADCVLLNLFRGA